MSKQTRQQKKEAEKRIIAEMESALAEGKKQEKSAKEPFSSETEKKRSYDETMPEKIHCKRCKTLMEKGVCPTCGFRIYVPMDKKKRDKTKLILAVVFMVAFLAVFILSQIKNS